MPPHSAASAPSNSRDAVPPPKITKESLLEAVGLFAYLLPYKFRFIAALLALFVSSLLTLALPFVAGKLVDSAIGGAGIAPAGVWQPSINAIVTLLLAILALQAVVSFFHSLAFSQVG